MSLFASSKKWEKESDQSVKVKAELDAHVATYPAARAAYEAGRPEVIRLTGELDNVRKAEGNSSEGYKKVAAELKKATLTRDAPLQIYGNGKHDLELELSQLNHLFISEEIERWKNETATVLSQKVNEEIPGEPNEKGTFTVGKGRLIRTNLAAIKTFREEMVENCNRLRDMIHCSIPEIEKFIVETEGKMEKLDLTPTIRELDAKGFMEFKANSAPEPGKTETGYVPPLGKPFIVNPQAPQANPNGEGDPLFKRFDKFKTEFKPRL